MRLSFKKILKKFGELEEFKHLLPAFIIYTFLKLLVYLNGLVFFDEGVYVGIAKYFISGGSIGYFETLRPLLLPLILAPFQLLPYDSLIVGRIVGFVLTVAGIIIVYYAAKIHFGNEPAFWSALLFAGSSSIVYFGGYILVDVIAAAISALSVSLVLKRRYAEAGLATGIAFLFKFPAIIVFPLLFIYLVFSERKKSPIPFIKMSVSSIGVALPFFIFNLIRYEGTVIERLIKPMMDARVIIENPTWIYETSSIFSYLTQLLTTEFIVVIFSIFAIYCLYKEKKEIVLFYLLCIISYLLYFGLKVPRYDARYIIAFLPLMIILAGYGIFNLQKRYGDKIKYMLIFIAVLPGLLTVAGSLSGHNVRNDYAISEYISSYEGKHLVTNTAFPLLYTKGKTTLFPGPSMGRTFLEFMEDDNAEWFIIDPDGYPCPPKNQYCIADFEKRISRILTENNIITCGMLHGSRVAIITKGEGKISAEECGKLIGYENMTKTETGIFIRLHGAVLTDEGSFANENNLKEVLNSISLNRTETIITIVSNEMTPNEETAEFIRSLPEEVMFGVIYKEGISPKKFIDDFNSITGKQIEFINPETDDWLSYEINIPDNVNACIRGSWDQTDLPIPCRTIDVYSVKSWKDKEFGD